MFVLKCSKYDRVVLQSLKDKIERNVMSHYQKKMPHQFSNSHVQCTNATMQQKKLKNPMIKYTQSLRINCFISIPTSASMRWSLCARKNSF